MLDSAHGMGSRERLEHVVGRTRRLLHVSAVKDAVQVIGSQQQVDVDSHTTCEAATVPIIVAVFVVIVAVVVTCSHGRWHQKGVITWNSVTRFLQLFVEYVASLTAHPSGLAWRCGRGRKWRRGAKQAMMAFTHAKVLETFSILVCQFSKTEVAEAFLKSLPHFLHVSVRSEEHQPCLSGGRLRVRVHHELGSRWRADHSGL